MLFKEIQDLLIQLTDSHGSIYLVGGCVRDAFIKKPNTDFDLIFESNAISAGRAISDYFDGDFYVLDPKRGTGRALFHHNGKNYKADCVLLNPSGITEDLKNRDFTINAMAVQAPEFSSLIDPLGGLRDLTHHHLRLCNSDGFIQDPVRVLRAVRFSIDFDLQMNAKFISLLKKAISLLSNVSSERIRDEIINILNTKSVRDSVQLINDLDLLDHIFPGMERLILIKPEFPHVYDGWDHTLEVVNYCQIFIDALLADSSKSHDPTILEAVGVLRKYGMGMREVISQRINPLREIKTLFYIAAIYHDTGKPFISPDQKNGKTRFLGHEIISEKIAHDFCMRMAFSNHECQFIHHLISGHMQPLTIKVINQKDFRRSAYHYYAQNGLAGVFICMMHLADVLSTYGQTISRERWQIALDVIDSLLDIWFHHYDDVVNPPKLVNGIELQKKFGIPPGRQLGELLERLQEEQAAGDISEVQEAHQFITHILNGGK